MKAVSGKPPNLSMRDDLWPLNQTDTLVLAGLAVFYLGSMFGLAIGGGR